MKHRIAYLTGRYPRATDTFIQREIAALRQLDHEVYTFSVREPDQAHRVGPEQIQEARQTEYILKAGILRMGVANVIGLVTHPIRYFKTIRLAIASRPAGLVAYFYQLVYLLEAGYLARRLRIKSIDHLHNHFANSSCTVAMLASELSGVPFSFTMHGPAIFFEPNRWRIDLKIQRALFVSCISHFCRSQAMIWADPGRWDRLHIVHCGVDPDGHAVKRHQGSAKHILFVGRLEQIKGVPVLLRAVKLLARLEKPFVLRIAGDGPDRMALEALAVNLGISDHVEFVGYRSAQEVVDDLAWSDMFVLPSFAEGVPVVLMEAMASGIPVVATRVGGVAELVNSGFNGLLVSPGDVLALAERMEEMMKDADLRNRLGASGRQTVKEDFNIEKEAARLSRIMVSAMGGSVETIRPSISENREAVA